MPKISITSLKKEIFCAKRVQTVLAAIKDNSIDWMHACGAKGRCTTCCIVVLKGQENLSNLTKNELYYHDLSMLKKNERLACQCTLVGDIIIQVPDSSRLPHLHYYD
jgi:2Fe-2S ferredoxin